MPSGEVIVFYKYAGPVPPPGFDIVFLQLAGDQPAQFRKVKLPAHRRLCRNHNGWMEMPPGRLWCQVSGIGYFFLLGFKLITCGRLKSLKQVQDGKN